MGECGHPGTALVEELDKRLLVQLRDGRKIVGVLRSFDQFANLVLEAAVERVVVGQQFAETPLGLYVVRGENVVLLGEIDEHRWATLVANSFCLLLHIICLVDICSACL